MTFKTKTLVLSLNSELLVQDINQSGLIEFFGKEKLELIDVSLLDLLKEQLMQAFLRNPGRFNHKQPQLKKLPKTVCINPPQSVENENKYGQPVVCLAS